MNNKGFTLVELLAVLIILTVIMGVAIPSISSSLERTKDKQNKAKEEMLLSYAEEYVTDHKNAVYDTLKNKNSCKISIKKLDDYLPEGGIVDADENEMDGYVLFTKPNKYKYCKDANGVGCSELNNLDECLV